MNTTLQHIFGPFPRWLSGWGYALPLLTLILIATGSQWTIIPIVVSAPIALAYQTDPPGNSIIGTLQIAHQDARKITLRQPVEVVLADEPMTRWGAIQGNVLTVRRAEIATDANFASPAQHDHDSYRRVLLKRMSSRTMLEHSESQIYTVTVIFSDGLRTRSGSEIPFRADMQGTVRIEIGKQSLLERIGELFCRKE